MRIGWKRERLVFFLRGYLSNLILASGTELRVNILPCSHLLLVLCAALIELRCIGGAPFEQRFERLHQEMDGKAGVRSRVKSYAAARMLARLKAFASGFDSFLRRTAQRALIATRRRRRRRRRPGPAEQPAAEGRENQAPRPRQGPGPSCATLRPGKKNGGWPLAARGGLASVGRPRATGS